MAAPSKSKTLFGCLIGLVGVLGFILLVRFGQTEWSVWSAAERDDDAAGYQQYLAKYPEGEHVQAARERIAELARDPEELTRFEALHKTFPDGLMHGLKNDLKFQPPFCFVFSDTDLSGEVSWWIEQTKSFSRARTIVFVKTRQASVGVYESSDGTPRSAALERVVTACLVDKEKPAHKRMVIAISSPAEEISVPSGPSRGGHYLIDGKRYEGSMDGHDLLLNRLIEHVSAPH